MKAKRADINESWLHKVRVVNRILRPLGINPKVSIYLDENGQNILAKDEEYEIIDFNKKVRISAESIERYFQEAIALINEHTNNKEDSPIIIDESKRIKLILEDIYNDHSKLLTLNCWEFEEITAELLHKQGCKVHLTQKRKDNGYDLVALMNTELGPLKFLVECKRYTNRKVGVEVIRSFKEVIDSEKANKGIIITTSYFTKGAMEKQHEIPYLLDYRDKDKVIELIKGYFNANWLS